MEQFLNLIISYNLYYLLETLLDLHRVTTEIFAGNALLHAVELGETRLVNLLLDKGCPLNATKLHSVYASPVTALEIAVEAQNIATTRSLLVGQRN